MHKRRLETFIVRLCCDWLSYPLGCIYNHSGDGPEMFLINLFNLSGFYINEERFETSVPPQCREMVKKCKTHFYIPQSNSASNFWIGCSCITVPSRRLCIIASYWEHIFAYAVLSNTIKCTYSKRHQKERGILFLWCLFECVLCADVAYIPLG